MFNVKTTAIIIATATTTTATTTTTAYFAPLSPAFWNVQATRRPCWGAGASCGKHESRPHQDSQPRYYYYYYYYYYHYYYYYYYYY